MGIVVGDLELDAGVFPFELAHDLLDRGHDPRRACAGVLDYSGLDRLLDLPMVHEMIGAPALPVGIGDARDVADIDCPGLIQRAAACGRCWGLGGGGWAHSLL